MFSKSQSSKVALDRRVSFTIDAYAPSHQEFTRWRDGTGYLTVSDASSGVNNPEWRRKIRQHENASSVYYRTKTSYSGGYGQSTVLWSTSGFSGGKPYTHSQYENETGRLVYVDIPTQPAYSSAADDAARAALLKHASQALTAFRSLTFLGELKETLHMIRSPAKALRQRLWDYIPRATKRVRRIRSNRLQLEAIRNSYLEETYGWAPLIGDVKAGALALDRHFNRFARSYTRVRGKGTVETSVQSSPTAYNNQGRIIDRYWGSLTKSSYSKLYYGEVKSVCPNPVQANMTLLGISWADVVLTGWELVPYSFVLDYFTNIGDILDSWTIRSSDWAWLSSVDKYESTCISTSPFLNENKIKTWPGLDVSKGYKIIGSCSPAVAKFKQISRATPLGPPSLGFQWQIPGLSSRKWLNIAALGARFDKASRAIRH